METNICAAIQDLNKDFIFGVATSGLQIEGKNSTVPRGVSIWDTTLGQFPNPDHELHYKTDIDLVKNMGLQAYRCSISWSRLMPNGRIISAAGVDFYLNLFQYIHDSGLQLWVTLYHWDLPLLLQDELGGWESPRIVEVFTAYASTCFSLFGHLVDRWITFNEPYVFTRYGYGIAECPPFKKTNEFRVAHNILLAHGAVYNLFKSKYSPKYHKQMIGITLNCAWREPFTAAEADAKATKYAIESRFDWFALPIAEGRYPDSLLDKVSCLPNGGKFKGPLGTDFIGINYYTTKRVRFNDKKGYIDVPIHPKTAQNSMGWAISPEGLGKLLKYVNNIFSDKVIYITENGYSDNDGRLEDSMRISYIQEHLLQILKSIKEDKIPLGGIFWWSLLDNIEWGKGIKPHFGLVQVDFADPSKKRTPKASYMWLKNQLTQK